MATKALPIHPLHQGVCGRHGAEERIVTPGDLIGCSTQRERWAKAAYKRMKRRGGWCLVRSRRTVKYHKRRKENLRDPDGLEKEGATKKGGRVNRGRPSAKESGVREEARE